MLDRTGHDLRHQRARMPASRSAWPGLQPLPRRFARAGHGTASHDSRTLAQGIRPGITWSQFFPRARCELRHHARRHTAEADRTFRHLLNAGTAADRPRF
ncbi:MAG: hypothetical protein [Inoviridae sp.]|nr:MAG: hypothetical protein [Inoviridae sp.]